MPSKTSYRPQTPSLSGNSIIPFHQTLSNHNLALERAETTILQVNIGLACNQTCTHCHLEAGPGRKEMMSRQTMDQIAVFAANNHFATIDITGGAPELHPDLVYFITKLSGNDTRLILRSNLSALSEKGRPLMESLSEHNVNIIASFPSLNTSQAESLRGKGVFDISVKTLRMLNSFGYGTYPDLDLVVNPTGAFLPPSQESLEKRFKKNLEQKWGIRFNRLFSFANVPLGRFRKWLVKSGNYETYMKKLVSSFNPSAINGLMCRTLLSVSWAGYLYDCDFNQAAGLSMDSRKIHISEISDLPKPGNIIAVDDHCYTCTAGAGFT